MTQILNKDVDKFEELFSSIARASINVNCREVVALKSVDYLLPGSPHYAGDLFD